MQLLLQFLLLSAGLVLLWKVGEVAVRNAVGFSVIYGIESFTVGFFIFAISTGLPEISSAIVSSLQKVPEISSGDLMGSTFVNISLVLGISLIIARKIDIDDALRKKLFRTIALIVIIFIGILFNTMESIFTGILLILVYVGAVFWFQAGIPKKEASKEIEKAEEKAEEIEKKVRISPKIDILIRLAVSLIFLLLSSWLTVYSAVEISRILNLNHSLVGATVIAIGTSLPELSLEIHAIRKKQYSLALGDIFGSSLLNISLILGLLVLMNPGVDLSFGKQIFPFLLASVAWFVVRLLQKKPIVRKDGYLFLGIFLCYMLFVLIRA